MLARTKERIDGVSARSSRLCNASRVESPMLCSCRVEPELVAERPAHALGRELHRTGEAEARLDGHDQQVHELGQRALDRGEAAVAALDQDAHRQPPAEAAPTPSADDHHERRQPPRRRDPDEEERQAERGEQAVADEAARREGVDAGAHERSAQLLLLAGAQVHERADAAGQGVDGALHGLRRPCSAPPAARRSRSCRSAPPSARRAGAAARSRGPSAPAPWR